MGADNIRLFHFHAEILFYKKDGISRDKALEEYHDLEVSAEEIDPDELKAARLSLRSEEEQRAVSVLENGYGTSCDPSAMRDAKSKIADLLGEERSGTTPISPREPQAKADGSTTAFSIAQGKGTRAGTVALAPERIVFSS